MSAYDTFAAMAHHNLIAQQDLEQWNAVVGLRNRIVHDYMNVDFTLIAALVQAERYAMVIAFLQKPIDIK